MKFTDIDVPVFTLEPGDKVWFVADPHFDHTNIIEFCSRPFNSVEEMNETILKNWKENIKPDDIVFFLGDMAFGRDSRSPRWWLTQLVGKIVYIKGSHDQGIRPTSTGLKGVLKVCRQAILETPERRFLLTHIPSEAPPSEYPEWEDWVIHGHYHDTVPQFRPKRVNVSLEHSDYSPISLDWILEKIKEYQDEC